MRPTPTSILRTVVPLLTLILSFALVLGWGAAQAAGTPVGSLLAQVPSEIPTRPQAVPSGVIPIPSNQPSVAVPNTNGTGTTTSSGGSFPWLILVILLVLIALGAIALVMARTRRPIEVADRRPMPPDAGRTRPYGVTPPATAPRTGPAVGGTAASAATGDAAGSAVPATITCPNCNTVNDWNENFCHDCGQDLRPVRASMLATMAPPSDVVTDDMPYLETLDRAEEQLEYVLSRRRIVIGSGAGCDIMVDSSFANSATVAGRHAQLTRNDDGSFSIADLGSPAGTFINNAQVAANTSAQLTDGAQIRVGNVRFVYRVP